jgi:competence protein ComEC
VSLVSVPANLLAAPAVAPATVLGLVAAILSLVSPALAAAVAAVAAWPVTWVADVGHAFARVPGGVLPWLPGPVGAALLTAAIGVAAVLVRRRARAGRQGVASAPARLVAVALVGVAGLVVVGARLPTVLSGPWPPAGWVLVACDVGQGDALVLPAGDDEAVVVDAGPDPQAVDDCLDELGVRRVALLVLTHLHADHVEGVPGVLSGRRVDQVLVGPYGEPAAEQRRVAAWTAARAPVRVAHPGDTWHAGATSLRVLWPSRVIEEESVPNNASIVLRVDVGDVRLLLTGDVEPPAQRALLAGPLRAPGILPVDVLKVPHHGSAAQMPGLLAGIGARVGVISVGAGNDYGHPAPSTVTALRRAGILVERTDRDGAVAVVGPAERLRVVEH